MTLPRPTAIHPDPGPDVVVVDTPVPDTITTALHHAGYTLAATTNRHAIYTPEARQATSRLRLAGSDPASGTPAGVGAPPAAGSVPARSATSGSIPAGNKAALSVTEAAQLLGVSRSHAYELVKTGTLPHFQLGRRILIPTQALRHLLDS